MNQETFEILAYMALALVIFGALAVWIDEKGMW